MDRLILDDIMTFVGLVIGIGCLTKIIVVWLHRRRPGTDGVEDLAQRLARIEQIVDTTAVEVERISEGQRFTSRLLAERRPVAGEIPRPPGPITPH
jgi:hypothetical protein